MAGQPTKLDGAMADRICAALADGMTREATADLCGIHRDTLNEYMRNATGEFSDALKMSEACAERTLLQRIADASTQTREDATQWQAAAWILERRFRDRWGRHDKVSLDSHVVSVPGAEMTDADKLRAAEEYVARLKSKDE
jgi:transcriptional regulator with XRE-family HTH domain